ncbi:MAG: DUF4286 family protein [Bacteroidota bacterium]
MKILYNVTVIVDDSVREDWKKWMMEIHIPDVMATGAFESYQMQKVLTEGSEGGTTFAIQYLAPSREEYERYQMQHAPRLQEDHTKRYQGKFGAFRTLMEVIAAG